MAWDKQLISHYHKCLNQTKIRQLELHTFLEDSNTGGLGLKMGALRETNILRKSRIFVFIILFFLFPRSVAESLLGCHRKLVNG